MKQTSFSSAEYAAKKRKTRRERFLAEMDAVVPWSRLEALIEPSKEIKEGFQAYRLTTKRGQSLVGLKIADKPDEVVLRDAAGKDVRTPRAEIEELAPAKASLMPDNVAAQLSFGQLLDLVAFLKDRAAQESLRPAQPKP